MRRRKGRRRRRRRRKKQQQRQRQQQQLPRQKRKQKPDAGSVPPGILGAARPWPGRTGTAAALGRSKRRTSRRSSSSRRRWGRRWRGAVEGEGGTVPSARGCAGACVGVRVFSRVQPCVPLRDPLVHPGKKSGGSGNTEENRTVGKTLG